MEELATMHPYRRLALMALLFPIARAPRPPRMPMAMAFRCRRDKLGLPQVKQELVPIATSKDEKYLRRRPRNTRPIFLLDARHVGETCSSE